MSTPVRENVYVVLLRRLSDGTAGVFVRLVLSLALALFFIGLALCGSYLAALALPNAFGWSDNFGGSGTISASPTDWTVGAAFTFSGVLWMGCLYWMWTRRMKWRVIWRSVLATVAIWVVAGFAMAGVADWFRGDEELLVGGIACLAGTFMLVVWAPVVGRLFVYGRPAFQADGRTFDVRCPSCKYSLVGLSEARCPECGQAYTLDGLLAAQGFARPDRAARTLKHTGAVSESA